MKQHQQTEIFQMEQGPMLPKIQLCSGNGSDSSFKVQYAPVYMGKAKSRPLSAYEEDIIKRALFGDDRQKKAMLLQQSDVRTGSAKTKASINVHSFDPSNFSIPFCADDGMSTEKDPTLAVDRERSIAVIGIQLVGCPVLTRRPQTNLQSPLAESSSGTTTGASTCSGIEHEVTNLSWSKTKRLNNEMIQMSTCDLDLGNNLPKDVIKSKLQNVKKAAKARQKAQRVEGELRSDLVPVTRYQPQLSVQPKTVAKSLQTELKRYQRRIVYMLNKVMTEAERKQFEDFVMLNGLRPKEYPQPSRMS